MEEPFHNSWNTPAKVQPPDIPGKWNAYATLLFGGLGMSTPCLQAGHV